MGKHGYTQRRLDGRRRTTDLVLPHVDLHDVGAQGHDEVLVQLLAERAGHLLDVPKVDQVAIMASLSVGVRIYIHV